MKKSTLLLLAALAAGAQTGFAADEVTTLPGGIIPSTKENPVYYTISNMRADRLSYITAEIYDADHTEVVGSDPDMYQQYRLPAYLPDENETPEIWDFNFMGLAFVENKFWTAFSAQNEVMDPQTIYWWFEKSKGNGVYIHNAIIDGALKNKAEMVQGQKSMSFSETAKQTYYVLPLNEEQLEDIEMTDDEFAQDAFALSKESALTDKDGVVTAKYDKACLDMNNYITFNWVSDAQAEDPNSEDGLKWKQVPVLDADGNPMKDENGETITQPEPVYMEYGFAGVKDNWNPLNHGNAGNENYRINNGSLFKVKKVEDVKVVEDAIKAYEEIVKQSYRDQVADYLESSKESIIDRLETLRNLPAIYGDGTKLDAIITSLDALNVDPTKVNTMEDVDVYKSQIDQDMEGQYLRAIALAGDKTVITLQQMLAIRDWSSVDGGEDDNVGNAYLSADGLGFVKYNDSMEEIGYESLTCLLEKDATCEWTMEWVAGQGYKLKNGDKYIRQFGNWTGMEQEFLDALEIDPEDLEEGQTVFDLINKNVMSWALTDDASLAAIFSFTANPTEVQQVSLGQEEQETVDTYYEDLGYGEEEDVFVTTNIAHLESTDPEGNATWLCRDTSANDYIVCSWNAGNRYFANPNCWKVEVAQAGEEIPDGIEEINANAKVAGIYDLQGRKVAKAAKGLYIINGVKTLVK